MRGRGRGVVAASDYDKLGSPGERIVDPRYIVMYKNRRWGTHRVGCKSLLLAVQLYHSIPASEFPAYLLNHADTEVKIKRISGNSAAENLTLQQVYVCHYGVEAWEALRLKTKGYQ